MTLVFVDNIIPGISDELGTNKRTLRRISNGIDDEHKVIKKIGRVEVQFDEDIDRDLARWAVTGEFDDASYYVAVLYMAHLNRFVRVDPETGLTKLAHEDKVELAFAFDINARLNEAGQVVMTATMGKVSHGFNVGDDEVNKMLVKYGEAMGRKFAEHLAHKRIVFAPRDELVTI